MSVPGAIFAPLWSQCRTVQDGPIHFGSVPGLYLWACLTLFAGIVCGQLHVCGVSLISPAIFSGQLSAHEEWAGME
jgi:hypothetical protein